MIRQVCCISFAAIALAILQPGAIAIAQSPAIQSSAWPHEGADIRPSPRVKWGRLENGLRYALIPNATPAERVSLRLVVLAGSLHENERELGYAHFVEHMAFNGTRNFPAGKLVQSLQSAGVSFGPHVNAYTTHTNTVYKLELADNREERVADGLRVLRDFADGILFEEDEVKRERGVILSEALARQNWERSWNEALNAFLYAGTLVPRRAPMGSTDVVRRATGEGLRRFYDAWYRPERIILTVAGDVDASTAENLIRQTFDGLRARAPKRPEPVVGEVLKERLRVALHAAPRAGVEINLLSVRSSPCPPDGLERRTRELRLTAALSMLRERFRRLVAKPGSPLTNFAVRHDRVFNHFDRVYVTTVGSVENWQQVLTLAEQELRRALEHGFHPSELTLYQESMRPSIEAAADEVSTIPSSELAEGLATAIESGRVFNLADEEKDAKLRALENLTAQDCWEALRSAWNAGSEMCFVGVDPAHAKRVRDVESVISASRKVQVEPAPPVQPVEFAYGDFGEPGRVIEKVHHEDLDVWLIRFANGVRLNVKTTAFEKSAVHFKVRFGSGRLTEPKQFPGLSQWAGPAWIYGGLGRHTIEEVLQAMNRRVGSLRANGAEDAMVLAGNAPAAHVETFLGLATAYFLDPAFAAGTTERIRPFINTLYSDLGRSMSGRTQRAIMPFLAGNDPRFGLPSYDVISAQKMTDLKAWLKPALENGYLEIALVGDIHPDRAIELVSRTLGTLPPRAPKPELAELRKLQLPVPPATRRYAYPFEFTKTSTVALYWPVRDNLDIPERRRLQLLAKVLEDRLRVKVREEMGATYSPNAGFSISEAYPGFAHLRCEIQVAPNAVRRMLPSAIEVSHAISKEGVSAEELARAKAQLLATAKQNLQSNTYWLDDVLADAQERPHRLYATRTVVSDIETATAADLNVLARRYLVPQNLFQFVIEPKR